MRVRAAALAGAALVLAGCGTAASGTAPGASVPASSSATTTPTTTPATTPTAAAPVTSALSFDLPATPVFRPDGTRQADGGQLVRTWRSKLPATSGGGSCVVVAGEQPGFSGAFPEAALVAFGLGHEDGSEIRYNEKAPPIAGTISGLRQSRTYRFSLGVRGTSTGVVLARQYLTADRTLISLNVAGPEDQAAACGLQAIVDSLRVATPGDRTPAVTLPSGTPTSRSKAQSTP